MPLDPATTDLLLKYSNERAWASEVAERGKKAFATKSVGWSSGPRVSVVKSEKWHLTLRPV